ncbi:MAG: hypothetical protein JXP34_12495, partial [Planctomycetes bacterium]|nr:hypothetical protein [Planctomycetota bacterium]
CSLQCNEYDKDETSCNIYIVGADGTGIRRLTVTKDGDYLPHTLADGTIGYTRWEYQERGWAHIQSIWNVRPDGTGADAIFKQHINEPWAIEEARSIPGSRRLAAVATGHHTLPVGPVIIVDSAVGMNNAGGIAIVTPSILPPEGGMAGQAVPEGGVRGKGGFFLTPWPLSEKHFLVSRTYGKETDETGYALYLIDVHGTNELLYRDPAISCSIPIPLRPRPRPPILADQTDPSLDYAVCSVSDVMRGVSGIARDRVKYIRIAQRLAWPYTIDGGGERYEPDVKGVMINWTPARILGDVPVASDGSAYFRVPIDQAIYFQLLDEDRMELRRMRSFINFQPGERRSCVGCHESREEAPPGPRFPLAVRRDPVAPEPLPWGARPISFLRDVQPVFDRNCVRCHAGLEPAAGLDLSGGLTPRANRAWDSILDRKLIARSNVGEDARITLPLEFGSHRSKLVEVIRGEAHRERIALSADDFTRIVAWIDANGPYHDGFIRKRPPVPPYDLPADRALADDIAAIHAKRCGACHDAAKITRLDWIDLRSPRRSLFLAAPLAKDAAGLGRCERAVYADANDADFRAILERVEAAVERAWREPRRDLRTADRGEIGALVPSPASSSR